MFKSWFYFQKYNPTGTMFDSQEATQTGVKMSRRSYQENYYKTYYELYFYKQHSDLIKFILSV